MPAAKFGGLALVFVMVLMIVVAAAAGGASQEGGGGTAGPAPLSAAAAGCPAINPCDANPCVHGTCSAEDIRSVADIGNKAVCRCAVGWGGSRCDQALATFDDDQVGGGWFLVRRTIGRWHPVDDDLAGTEEYGVYERNPLATSTFSVAFDSLTMPGGQDFDQYLFASGDMTMWAVMDRGEVSGCQNIMMNGGSGSGNGGWNPTVAMSSDSQEPTTPLQYCRSYCCDEDPWISKQHCSLLVHATATCAASFTIVCGTPVLS